MYPEIPFLIYQIGKNSKRSQYTLWARLWGNRHSQTLLVEMQNGTTLCKGTGQYLIKLLKHLLFEPVSPLPGIYPEDKPATI